MSRYIAYKKRSLLKLPRRIWMVVAVLLLFIVVGAVGSQIAYRQELRPVNSVNYRHDIFTVRSGSSVKTIADQLEQAHLIRSSWAMQLYVHSKQLSNNVQAGTYAFSPSETTAQIVDTMVNGRVTSKLVTILPGRRIDQIRADLINDGFSPTSVDAALQPQNYTDLPVLAFKPPSSNTLEGLLWPDSFEKNDQTAPSVIIRESLAEMQQHITASVQASFASEGLTVYQGITLASIIEQEVSKPNDQTQVAQVFLNRLRNNMSLGSDVTAYYGSLLAGKQPSLSYDTPYNTLIHTGLPPTPISTITTNALYAATHPANTNWVYFVTGDNGTTYFSTNLADQQANTAKYCHKLCALQ